MMCRTACTASIAASGGMTGNEFRSALEALAVPQRRLALWLAAFGTTTERGHIDTVRRWANAGDSAVPDTAAAIVDLLGRVKAAGAGLPMKA